MHYCLISNIDYIDQNIEEFVWKSSISLPNSCMNGL